MLLQQRARRLLDLGGAVIQLLGGDGENVVALRGGEDTVFLLRLARELRSLEGPQRSPAWI